MFYELSNYNHFFIVYDDVDIVTWRWHVFTAVLLNILFDLFYSNTSLTLNFHIYYCILRNVIF